jgi:pyruvate dehydrogenase (quinone)
MLMQKNTTLVFVVLVNDDLNQVSMEQRVLSGDPKNPDTQSLPYLPAADYAKLLGFEGIKVERPEDVGPAWDRALSADGPVLLEFCTDPSVAALPPHVKPAMMKKVAKALMHGDEDRVGIAEHGFTGKLAELTEHAKEKLGRTDE